MEDKKEEAKEKGKWRREEFFVSDLMKKVRRPVFTFKFLERKKNFFEEKN